MNNILHTKYGTAKIQSHGYYVITSKKEGNNNKRLHRLIYEDFYNCEVPEGYVIHHKNGNKTDNCILNLQLMRWNEHNKLHMTDEHKRKISESSSKKNTSGYYRVHKRKDNHQGFIWIYSYYENGKLKIINSYDIKKLEYKVKSKNLPWKKYE